MIVKFFGGPHDGREIKLDFPPSQTQVYALKIDECYYMSRLGGVEGDVVRAWYAIDMTEEQFKGFGSGVKSMIVKTLKP